MHGGHSKECGRRRQTELTGRALRIVSYVRNRHYPSKDHGLHAQQGQKNL